MKLRSLAVVFLSLILSTSAFANVALKNGNFFMGYTDIIYPGGFEPKIERVYNSKTPFKGMFGWGWGNEYEVYLVVSADGSVVVHEYGGGAENRFNSPKFDASELQKAVDQIGNAAKAAGLVPTSAQLESYKTKLKSDAMFRNDEWQKFIGQKKLEPRKLAVNTQLVSNRFSFQYITRVADGYLRVFENGKVEKFNDAGKLARVQDKNGNFLEFAYSKEGLLSKVVDNFNRKIFFTFNSARLLEKIDGENGKVASYKYNSSGDLIESKDVDGNVYRYEYSADNRHNLTRIIYADVDPSTKKAQTMDIAYYGKELFENVKSIKDKSGTFTEYTYKKDGSDKGHITIGVNIKGKDGKMISSSVYEYFNKYKANGEEWTYRLISTLDGDKTDTTYNECCGLPLIIKRNGEETAFEYNARGQVTKKITPSDVTELSYDAKVSKVNKVVHYSKKKKNEKTWSQFEYDAKGNLLFAKNSSNKAVKLFYDNVGRIKSMVDQDRRRLDFKYNDQSKPIEISDPQLGTITVSYTNSGEIKKVDSSAGRKIAVQVTTSFQNLLDIIRPAGVSLSF